MELLPADEVYIVGSLSSNLHYLSVAALGPKAAMNIPTETLDDAKELPMVILLYV